MEIEKSFFARDTEKVAEDLLGCTVSRNGMKGKIVETEAYLEDDPASHAYPKKTERNRLMYDTHGRVYVYLCYGIHHMLNFTTEMNGTEVDEALEIEKESADKVETSTRIGINKAQNRELRYYIPDNKFVSK
jgi:DNA-3-methyladenine glycosylase